MPRFPAGFEVARQAGTSHAIYFRARDNRRTVVPIHAGKTIKRRTLAAMLRDADLDVEAFRLLMKS